MRVLTKHAESSLRQLYERSRDYRAGIQNQLEHGWSGSLSVGVMFRDANAMVDVVAIAESYCVARLTSVDPSQDAGTWVKRMKSWKKLGVDLADFQEWDCLMGFIEARNAIQHGLGCLTDRQLVDHKQQVLAQLDAASIRVDGDLLYIDREDVDRLIAVTGKFVRWLDAAI